MELNLNEIECHLLPYIQEDVFQTLSDAQQYGWQITAFNLPDVWKYSQGEGVTVAVVDTGIQLDHKDLAGNILAGYNFVNDNNNPCNEVEQEMHGTHVAGIVGANNNDSGVVGVAPKAKIMPLKVLDKNGAGNMSSVISAINYAVKNGADIISMSLGTRTPVPAVQDAIKEAAKNGVICFVAAGNAGASEQLLYPAAYSEVIAIGAVDENSMRANFSCTGPNLDFVAPGVRIFSTVPTNSYTYLSGTSQAAPFVAGIAALVLSSARKRDPKTKLYADDYRNIFKQNTMDVKNLQENLDAQGKKFWEGFGIIEPSKFKEWAAHSS
jgi:major intracellular serine protease